MQRGVRHYCFAVKRSILASRRKTPDLRRSTIPPVPPPKRHPYDQWSPDARALDLVGDKWTLLIIRDLAAGPRRFVELQRVLPRDAIVVAGSFYVAGEALGAMGRHG